jgi:hypothetical protein
MPCGHILICLFSDVVNCTQQAYEAVQEQSYHNMSASRALAWV